MESSLGSNWRFRHVGLVVRDMDKAVKEYESILGAGVFRPETMLDSSTFSQYKVYGKTPVSVHKSRFKHSDIGPDKLDLEFIPLLRANPSTRISWRSRGRGYITLPLPLMTLMPRQRSW